MKVLTIQHSTRYRYAEPVNPGQHRLMIRPRDSHDLRLLEATLTISPPGVVKWIHDIFGNSIALIDFEVETRQLEFLSTLRLERYAAPESHALLDDRAARYPFIYSSEERVDIGQLATRHYPDDGALNAWLQPLVGDLPTPTLELFERINLAIRGLSYSAREEQGTQNPADTLARGEGTCRDYALLFMEAARELGVAARFVTGYLYDPKLDRNGPISLQGGASTHAWAEIYLPGAGWLEYDPTNALVGSDHLVRVAVVRDPKQASPITGSFVGPPGAFLSMDVDVAVSAAD